jgi:biotin operon repressor
MSNGWIKLHRKIIDKAFYCKDSEKVHLWIHLLLKANHYDYEEMLGGKPILCKSGQFTTGRKQLSSETGISESKVERILTYLEKIEQQIEQQKTNTNRLISIINWNEYQHIEQQTEQQVNNDRTTTEQQLNTLQEDKEVKNKYLYSAKKFYDLEKEKTTDELYHGFIDYIFGNNPTETPLKNVLKIEKQLNYKSFCSVMAKSREKGVKVLDIIMKIDNYSKGKYSNLYRTILNWVENEKK